MTAFGPRPPKSDKTKPDKRKPILICTALGIVVTCLFPPWLYTFDQSGTHDKAGYRYERSAGYKFILRDPYHLADELLTNWSTNTPSDQMEHDVDRTLYSGVRLDTARLLVEWVCILTASGAAWGVVRLNKGQDSAQNPLPPEV
jgi:hypothetical protein